MAEKVDGRVARRDDTQQAILDAALALFAAKGVTSTTVDDIAARAGTAKGSIYYNFGSKDKVVEALMQRHALRLVQSLDTAAVRAGAQGRHDILRTLLHDLSEHPDVAQLMVAEMFRTDRRWLEIVREWMAAVTRPLEENLVHEQGEEHRVRCSLQASALVGATLTVGLDWLVFHPEQTLEDVFEALSTLPAVG